MIAKMHVDLLAYTPGADLICGLAAAECYQGTNFDKSLNIAMGGGHLSVVEHAAFTFRVTGVSRVLLAQLTRHRIASFSVQSQRYCSVTPEWIVPQTIVDVGYRIDYLKMCNECYNLLCKMIKDGVPAEDARYVIPQGVACSLIVTMNVRELLHFFELRCCNRAQWEIRNLAWAMLAYCKCCAPKVFKTAGPSCAHGPCPEGKKSCGKPYKEDQNHADTRTEAGAAEEARQP